MDTVYLVGVHHHSLVLPAAEWGLPAAPACVTLSTMPTIILASADAAAALVPEGATVMFGGFISAGFPANLIRALVRRGTGGLTGIATNIGPNDDLDILAETGQLRKMITSFAIRPQTRLAGAFERRWRAGEVELELVPQGTLAERIRAGGAGIPAFYVPVGAGTVVAEGKEIRLIGGQECIMETALIADVALIRAQQADTAGNLRYFGAGRNFNQPMATAARLVIAEVEEIVPTGHLAPDHVNTPSVYVDYLVQCAPTGDLRRQWPNV